jgi:hypothetical protein
MKPTIIHIKFDDYLTYIDSDFLNTHFFRLGKGKVVPVIN